KNWHSEILSRDHFTPFRGAPSPRGHVRIKGAGSCFVGEDNGYGRERLTVGEIGDRARGEEQRLRGVGELVAANRTSVRRLEVDRGRSSQRRHRRKAHQTLTMRRCRSIFLARVGLKFGRSRRLQRGRGFVAFGWLAIALGSGECGGKIAARNGIDGAGAGITP